VELGGYGNMKFYSASQAGAGVAAVKRPAAWGTYTLIQWLPGSSEPGMKAFEDAYVQKYGKTPDSQTPLGYNCFWIAIKAIEMAGTDNPDKIAQALRSGKLEWDSAFGPLLIDSNGEGIMQYGLAQIQEGGKLVQVWP
jgi:branched-chain amino acid transport system substrate-binding protein